MPNKGGLGRGLGAIIPPKNQRSDTEDAEKDLMLGTPEQRLKEVPVSKIVPNPHQPRHEIDKKEIESLAESLKEYGLLQPLVVQEKGRDKYELIAGHRRLAAAKLAGFTSVPVIVRPASKSKKLEIALVENIQRQDLNPIEEAEAFKVLIERFFLDLEDVAKKVGRSTDFIQSSLRILSLPSRIKQGLEAGKISRGHALIFLSLSERGAQLHLYKKTLAEGWSARELKYHIQEHERKKQEYIEGAFRRAKITRAPKEKSLKFLEAEEVLESVLGTKVTVDKKGTIGKITIEFYSDEDLETILAKLRKAED